MTILHAFGSSSTRPTPLEHLADKAAPGVLRTLALKGFGTFTISVESVCEMAREAAAQALARAALAPADIGALFIVTESFWDSAGPRPHRQKHIEFRQNMVARLVLDAGLRNAAVFGVWGAACGSLPLALRLARGLLDAGEVSHALLVAADRLPADADRVRPPGSAVYSDLAAACILSREADKGFALQGLVQAPSAALLETELAPDATTRQAEAISEALISVDAGILARTGRRIADHELVLFENFNQIMLDWFAGPLSIDPGKMRTPGRREDGHAFAADLLVGLARLETEPSGPPPGAFVAAVSLSSWTPAAASFQRL